MTFVLSQSPNNRVMKNSTNRQKVKEIKVYFSGDQFYFSWVYYVAG